MLAATPIYVPILVQVNAGHPISPYHRPLEICRLGVLARPPRSGGRPHSGRLAEIAQVGKNLADAPELASETEPNTVDHRSAWARAERLLERLPNVVSL